MNFLAMAMRWNPGMALAYLSRRKKRYYWLKKTAPKVLLITDSALAQSVLTGTGESFIKNSRFRRGLGLGLSTAEGEPWKSQRNGLTACFPKLDPQTLLNSNELFSNKLHCGLVAQAHQSESVDISNVAGGMSLNLSLGLLVDGFEISPVLNREFRSSVRQAGDSLYAMAWGGRQSKRANAKLSATLGFVDRLVADVVQFGEENNDSMTPIMRHILNYPTLQERLDQTKTLIVAGYETVSVAAAWLLYRLGLDPQLQDAARSSLVNEKQTLARGGLIYRIISENLRVYPPAWLLSRTTSREAFIDPLVLAPDTKILLPVILFNRRRMSTDFELGDLVGRTSCRGVGLTFGGGQRHCIGADFARWELNVIVSTILKSVRWTSSERAGPFYGATLRPRKPVRILLEALE